MTMKRPAKKNKPAVLDAVALEAIAAAVRPVELSDAQRVSMRKKITDRISPGQPSNTETVRGETVEWMSVWPNVWVKMLRQDPASNLQMVLFRIKPGGVVPAHVHTKEEECLVLDGEIFIGDHRVGEGDLHIAKPGAAHGNITTLTGATVLVRSEIPPKYLKTLLARSAVPRE
jgi:quercetin dioxygenase-like cupin family protein